MFFFSETLNSRQSAFSYFVIWISIGYPFAYHMFNITEVRLLVKLNCGHKRNDEAPLLEGELVK